MVMVASWASIRVNSSSVRLTSVAPWFSWVSRALHDSTERRDPSACGPAILRWQFTRRYLGWCARLQPGAELFGSTNAVVEDGVVYLDAADVVWIFRPSMPDVLDPEDSQTLLVSDRVTN
jgi:hypothetical protein